MRDWAKAIHDAGAPAPRCIGFIDGTFRPHCRPTRNQRQCYQGYKRMHGIKFQSVPAPNGLIVDLYGCVVGAFRVIVSCSHTQAMLNFCTLVCQVVAVMHSYLNNQSS